MTYALEPTLLARVLTRAVEHETKGQEHPAEEMARLTG